MMHYNVLYIFLYCPLFREGKARGLAPIFHGLSLLPLFCLGKGSSDFIQDAQRNLSIYSRSE